MSIVLNTTMSDETANSYVTEAYADDYFANHLVSSYSTQWAALSTQQKINALVRACGTIEQCRFVINARLPEYGLYFSRQTGAVLDIALTREPMKWYYYQKLQFPRNIDVYYVNPVPPAKTGDRYIPEPIMMAQCEQAIYLINFDQTALANRMQGITMETVGIGKQQIVNTQQYAVGGTSVAPLAVELMMPYFYRDTKTGRG